MDFFVVVVFGVAVIIIIIHNIMDVVVVVVAIAKTLRQLCSDGHYKAKCIPLANFLAVSGMQYAGPAQSMCPSFLKA